jgi:hypothetical protein
MSEKEVSSLVHNALQRARQATSSVSPRRRTKNNIGNPLSPASQSSTHSKPPTSPTKSGLFFPRDDEILPKSSFRSRSSRMKYMKSPSTISRADPEITRDSFNDEDESFKTTVSSHEDIDANISTLSADGSEFRVEESKIEEEDYYEAPTLTSVNSSEAIIRRVEEEIANARKAAQEANRRLEGVSADLQRPIEQSATNDSSLASDPDLAIHGILSISGSEGGWDSAMDVIGEEFDFQKSFGQSRDAEDQIEAIEEVPSMERQESATSAKKFPDFSEHGYAIDVPQNPSNESVDDYKYAFETSSIDGPKETAVQDSMMEVIVISESVDKDTYASPSLASQDGSEMPDDENTSYGNSYVAGNIDAAPSEESEVIIAIEEPSETPTESEEEITSAQERSYEMPSEDKKKEEASKHYFSQQFSAQGNIFMRMMEKAGEQEAPKNDVVYNASEYILGDRSSTSSSKSEDESTQEDGPSVYNASEYTLGDHSSTSASKSEDESAQEDNPSVYNASEYTLVDRSIPPASKSEDESTQEDSHSVYDASEYSLGDRSTPPASKSEDESTQEDGPSVHNAPEYTLGDRSIPSASKSEDESAQEDGPSVYNAPEYTLGDRSIPSASKSEDFSAQGNIFMRMMEKIGEQEAPKNDVVYNASEYILGDRSSTSASKSEDESAQEDGPSVYNAPKYTLGDRSIPPASKSEDESAQEDGPSVYNAPEYTLGDRSIPSASKSEDESNQEDGYNDELIDLTSVASAGTATSYEQPPEVKTALQEFSTLDPSFERRRTFGLKDESAVLSVSTDQGMAGGSDDEKEVEEAPRNEAPSGVVLAGRSLSIDLMVDAAEVDTTESHEAEVTSSAEVEEPEVEDSVDNQIDEEEELEEDVVPAFEREDKTVNTLATEYLTDDTPPTFEKEDRTVDNLATEYLTDDTPSISTNEEGLADDPMAVLPNTQDFLSGMESEERKEDPEGEMLPPMTLSHEAVTEQGISVNIGEEEEKGDEEEAEEKIIPVLSIEIDDIVLAEIGTRDEEKSVDENNFEVEATSCQAPTEIVANDGETRDTDSPLLINLASTEGIVVGEDPDEPQPETESKKAVADAPRSKQGSPRRKYWCNKAEQDAEKKKKAEAAQTPDFLSSGDSKTSSEISAAGNESTVQQETIDPPGNRRRDPTPPRGNRNIRPPSPQPASRARSPHRRKVSSDLLNGARAPSPVRTRAPSPQRVALIEHRREVRSRANEARAAIGDELGISEQKTLDDFNRSNKVRFRQRYPVPPLMAKVRSAEDILEDNQVDVPEYNLYLAKPKRELMQLLDAATGESLPRRANACGALKVLATQKKNKLTLVRTQGFLDALVFAAGAKIPSRDFEIAIDARTRAVDCIRNIAEPKDNRSILFSHPGLPYCLVKCIIEDKAEARTAACGALAILAKTPSCRDPMSKTHNLVDILAIIMKGVAIEKEPVFLEKPEYSADDEGSIRNSYSSESSGSSSRGSYGSQDGDDLPPVLSMRQEKQEKTSETAKRGRLNACAALMHLSKQCTVTVSLCILGHSEGSLFLFSVSLTLSPFISTSDCLVLQ